MENILVVIHVIVSVFLIVIVLLQQGKGADIGATFGGGGGNTLFGTEGPMPLMNKVTTTVAVIFMVTSISLAYISAHQSGSVMKAAVAETKAKKPEIPMAPAAAKDKDAAPLPVADAVPEKAPASFPGAAKPAATGDKAGEERQGKKAAGGKK